MRTVKNALGLRLLLAVGLAIALGGCATGPRQVQTQVTSFNDWSALPGKSYVFARTLEYQSSLEMKSYEDVVRDEMARQGFTLAADSSAAQVVVTIRPSVAVTQLRVRDPWPYDPFGRGFGWYGRRGFGGYDPFWNDWREYNVDVYRRRVELDIDSRTVAGKRYYEGRVENTGDTDDLPAAMPYLIRALFADFPGNNGQTRRVDVPIVPMERTIAK